NKPFLKPVLRAHIAFNETRDKLVKPLTRTQVLLWKS
ncbi:MAG: hypothetical protein ACI8XV_000378, partial [Arenicella sp.]